MLRPGRGKTVLKLLPLELWPWFTHFSPAKKANLASREPLQMVVAKSARSFPEIDFVIESISTRASNVPSSVL
jgi:hypothetical protein